MIMKHANTEPLAQVLAEFVQNVHYDCFDPGTTWRAKICVLDMIGVMMAAWPEQSTQILYRWLQRYGSIPESSVLGAAVKLPAANAAMINSMMAHSLELEDHHSHKRSLNHPGVCTIPASLAIAEREKKSGQEFLTAVILGYEVGGRISSAAKLGVLNIARGFHESSVVGPFSAVTVTGKLLGLPSKQIAQAYGISGSMAAGSMEFKSSEAWSKRLQVGNATRNGVMAVELAREGFTGPPTILEGKHGFYHSYVTEGHYDITKVTKALGDGWDINHIQFKPFACAGVLHSVVTAAAKAREIYNFNSDEIRRVKVFTATKVVEEYAEPIANKATPKTPVGAQFSLQYSVAAMLVKGRALLGEFSYEAIRDPQILRVAKLVIPIADKTIDVGWPGIDPTEMEIELADGKVIKVRVEEAKGDLVNPVTDEEVICKFKELTAPFLTDERIESVIAAIERLETMADIGELTELLIPNRCM